ncbi:esterase-like activity of phytase family protein [Actinomycetospora termitidis]|uniref:Esterase-like activity of phytase family protein n=1 Tax=Actinomycetospora termitidis TaxID=3053470 RepID=A0ABT7MCM9_9PSEU|nr:esterase-like activity of phytase family protein [Actinomycetospora sp. Odt1-22]MDL5158438.1 esterase-like activity of phytase family protein [Actinomycetospora sp. Odt1-22]
MRRLLLVAVLVLAGCGAPPPPPPAVGNACSPSTTIESFSDVLEGQVANLSALAARPDGTIYVLSDRSVLYTLDAGATRPLASVPLADPAAKPLDSESLVVDPDGTLTIGDETGPQVLRYAPDGRLLGSLGIPADVVGRTQDNASFEGLARQPDGSLVASLEKPLTGETDTRLVTIPDGPQVSVPLAPGLGIAELVALGDGRLLALERGYDEATGNTVHLVLLDPRTNPAGSTLVADLGACPTLGATSQQAQRNPLLDNVEGMTITGRTPDGALELLLVSDDNDNPEQVTRTYRLRVAL